MLPVRDCKTVDCKILGGTTAMTRGLHNEKRKNWLLGEGKGGWGAVCGLCKKARAGRMYLNA